MRSQSAVWGMVALALGVSVTPRASADTATMTRYFDDQARQAYTKLRYKEALEYFLLVDRATPSPRAAYNVAVTADAARDLELQYTYLRRYLDAPDEDEARQKDAKRRIAALETRLALVTVESDPPGAAVFVDKRELGSFGVTPCTIVVEPGERRILLDLAGHDGASTSVEAAKGERKTTKASLRPKTGSLLVNTKPAGARWVAMRNGRQIATGRGGTASDVPVGSYRIRIEPDGHKPEQATVTVGEDARAEISLLAAALPPKVGRLLLATGEARGQLYVDGIRTASTPATLDTIPVGTHSLEVRAKGYVVWRGTVAVKEGETSFIEAKMKRSMPVGK